ncbi:MAG: DUF6328 family protein [Ilumatobacter sp.]
MTAGADSPTDADTTVDEQFRSLLEGLRTSIPAVQVLFAFLLTAPLQGEFDALTEAERVAFAIAFYSSGAASVLLVAPSVHQRLRAPVTGMQRHSKRHLIWATWMGIAGSVMALVAISATVYLVSNVVFNFGVAAIATALTTALALWSWLFVPLISFRSR